MESSVYMWVYLIGIPVTIFVIGFFAPKDSFFNSSNKLVASESNFMVLGIAAVWPVWPTIFLFGSLVSLLTLGVRLLFGAGSKCFEMCTKT